MWEGGVTSSKLEGDVDTSTRGGLYEDAEARTFYEDLVDLLSQVPLTVLGLTPEQVSCTLRIISSISFTIMVVVVVVMNADYINTRISI